MSVERLQPLVVVLATQGAGSQDANRVRALLGGAGADWSTARSGRVRGALRLLRRLKRSRPDLVVMEGTGLAAGLPLIAANVLWATRFVVSSGDAVGPFYASRGGRLAGVIGLAYEALLYRRSAGVIGWSPYVVGRAITLGARRGITAENWAEGEAAPGDRERVRASLGIPERGVVYGIAGSIRWNERHSYAYGLELVRARLRSSNEDAYVLIVGDGTGEARLRELAGLALDSTILMPGRVLRAEVPAYLAAMDYGLLPQSLDGVGLLRYTTKLSEYLSAGLPVVSTRIPAAYDVLGDGGVPLPGENPWSEVFVAALAGHMNAADARRAAADRARARDAKPARLFDRRVQVDRVEAFLRDILREGDGRGPAVGS